MPSEIENVPIITPIADDEDWAAVAHHCAALARGFEDFTALIGALGIKMRHCRLALDRLRAAREPSCAFCHDRGCLECDPETEWK